MSVWAGAPGASWNEPLRPADELHHYYDREFSKPSTKIHPGQCYATRDDQVMVTVLGSCVSACIRDRALGIGGMNHFMLPSKDVEAIGEWERGIANAANRYGNHAMESLINAILRLGGSRQNLEIKLFGGGQIIRGMTDVGAKNILFVREYLRAERLGICSEDLGGLLPRKVAYFTATGKVLVKKIGGDSHASKIASRDQLYGATLEREPVAGEVELFD